MRKVSKSGDPQNIWYDIKKPVPIADSRLVFPDASKPWTRKQCCITWLGWFPPDQLGPNGLLKLVQRGQHELGTRTRTPTALPYCVILVPGKGSSGFAKCTAKIGVCVTNSRLYSRIPLAWDKHSLRMSEPEITRCDWLIETMMFDTVITLVM